MGAFPFVLFSSPPYRRRIKNAKRKEVTVRKIVCCDQTNRNTDPTVIGNSGIGRDGIFLGSCGGRAESVYDISRNFFSFPCSFAVDGEREWN
jgi:hypothetical protein